MSSPGSGMSCTCSSSGVAATSPHVIIGDSPNAPGVRAGVLGTRLMRLARTPSARSATPGPSGPPRCMSSSVGGALSCASSSEEKRVRLATRAGGGPISCETGLGGRLCGTWKSALLRPTWHKKSRLVGRLSALTVSAPSAMGLGLGSGRASPRGPSSRSRFSNSSGSAHQRFSRASSRLRAWICSNDALSSLVYCRWKLSSEGIASRTSMLAAEALCGGGALTPPRTARLGKEAGVPGVMVAITRCSAIASSRGSCPSSASRYSTLARNRGRAGKKSRRMIRSIAST
mmetsp:Transcript_24881/g.63042  ORF Transcript_24881/g.63042 Transcript_24881/m.63042 type:complete len:288 (-) Transcript_24881:260-1123(-)